MRPEVRRGRLAHELLGTGWVKQCKIFLERVREPLRARANAHLAREEMRLLERWHVDLRLHSQHLIQGSCPTLRVADYEKIGGPVLARWRVS